MASDRTTGVERLITWLGAWGAMREAVPLVLSVAWSVLLLELLVPSAARLLPDAPRTILHVFAVGLGMLLGLVGHFLAGQWDRLAFDRCYGPSGRWLATPASPLPGLPSGARLQRARLQAGQALVGARLDRGLEAEAVKTARRQVERWERIEHPLLLSRCLRAFLWSGLSAGVLAVAGAVAALLTNPMSAPRLIGLAAAYLLITAFLLAPYATLRARYLCELYEDVAAHAKRRRAAHRPEG